MRAMSSGVMSPLAMNCDIGPPGARCRIEKPRTETSSNSTADCVSRRAKKPLMPAPRAPARKLSFKDKHALETLPGRIAALEAEIAALETKLADAQLYVRDPKAFAAATARHEAARGELDAAESQWLEIEMRREELGA